MGKRRPKRLFPKKLSAHYVPVSRFDANRAAAYNAQRSKATLRVESVIGPGLEVRHNPESNFLTDIPRTRGRIVHSEEVYVKTSDGIIYKVRTLQIQPPSQKTGEPKQKDLVTLYRAWSSGHGRHSGVEEFYRRKIYDNGKGFQEYLLFSGTVFIILREFGDTRRLSRIYSSAADALLAHKNNSVEWEIKESISAA